MNLYHFSRNHPQENFSLPISWDQINGLTNLAVPVIKKSGTCRNSPHITVTSSNNTYRLTTLDSIGPFDGEGLPLVGGSKTASTLLCMQRKVSGKKDRL